MKFDLRLKSLILSSLSASLFSCNNEIKTNGHLHLGKDLVPIHLGSSEIVASPSHTRAPIINNTFAKGVHQLGIFLNTVETNYISQTDYNNTKSLLQIISNDYQMWSFYRNRNELAHTLYAKRNDSIEVVGYFPYQNNIPLAQHSNYFDHSKIPFSTASQTDYLWTKENYRVTQDNSISLSFHHLFACFSFKVGKRFEVGSLEIHKAELCTVDGNLIAKSGYFNASNGSILATNWCNQISTTIENPTIDYEGSKTINFLVPITDRNKNASLLLKLYLDQENYLELLINPKSFAEIPEHPSSFVNENRYITYVTVDNQIHFEGIKIERDWRGNETIKIQHSI